MNSMRELHRTFIRSEHGVTSRQKKFAQDWLLRLLDNYLAGCNISAWQQVVIFLNEPTIMIIELPHSILTCDLRIISEYERGNGTRRL